ncbi:MAG: hypothetical protein AUK47_25670 [Deltaproteobacteria bacterium CG2_30_63_29]|nr:MAG: hypothetical protein AUK47_25670 [Deltaproteobacteria bacterium CG2_30_63_29]PJB33248.1 MAG: hypothetical protein CO108_31310 [Deltaproteobacteria bacterium CG_4_9_14_3_um_filter_63_12]
MPQVSFIRILSSLLRLALVLSFALVAACEEPPPRLEEPPGVSVAQRNLTPYQFDKGHTLRGTRILEHYLKDSPNGRDARMATWLLGRTYFDGLTRVLTLAAEGMARESDALMVLLATELSVEPRVEAIARGIRVRLEALAGDDPISKEAKATVVILNAMLAEDRPAFFGQELSRIAASDVDVSNNARLIMSARSMKLFKQLGEASPEGRVRVFAAQYPFTCPVGFDAFSKGDSSLAACNFVCEKASSAKAAEQGSKAFLVKMCGAANYGFDSKADAVYLSKDNYVLSTALKHMADNALVLSSRSKELPLIRLHLGYIKNYDAFLSALTMPARIPLLAADDEQLEVPELKTDTQPTEGVQQMIAVTEAGIQVDLPGQFRVGRGQVYVPQVILRYQFPGRLAVTLDEPFQANARDLEEGKLTGMGPYLDDLVKDRPRLQHRADEVARGVGFDPQNPLNLALLPLEQRLTQLLIDRRTSPELLLLLLKTLHDQGYHPFEMVVWDPEREQPGVVRFETELGPVPLGNTVVWLSHDDWVLKRQNDRKARSSATDFGGLMVELYRAVVTLDPFREGAIYLSVEGLNVVEIATAVEVLGFAQRTIEAREVREIDNLEQLLGQPQDKFPLAKADATPTVILALQPQHRP